MMTNHSSGNSQCGWSHNKLLPGHRLNILAQATEPALPSALLKLLLPGLGRHIVCTPGGCIALCQSTTFRHHKSHRNVPRLNLKAIRCHEALRYALQNHIAAHSRFRINKRIPTPLHQAPQSYKIFLCSQSVVRYLNEEFLRAAQPLNLPRLGPESWTVRDPGVEPSTLRLDITDGPCLRSEPSTIMLNIADGSTLQDRTFHVNASYHGWFSIQTRTLHTLGLNHGQFEYQGWNLPR